MRRRHFPLLGLCWAESDPKREQRSERAEFTPPPSPPRLSLLPSPLPLPSCSPCLPVPLSPPSLPLPLSPASLPLPLPVSPRPPLTRLPPLPLLFLSPSPSLWLAGSLSSPVGSVGGGRSLTQPPPQLRGCGGCGGAGPGRRQEDGQGPRVSPAPAGPGPWPVCRWIGRGPLPRHRHGPQARGFCGAGVARASGSRRARGVLWGVLCGASEERG